jgi:hypothetical protein
MIFKNTPSSSRQKPPTKSRAIHVLPLPLATSERRSAINHMNKASLRITSADYTAELMNADLLTAQSPGFAPVGA